MFKKLLKSSRAVMLMAILVVSLSFFNPVSQVFASSSTTAPVVKEENESALVRVLESAYKVEKIWLAKQTAALAKADTFVVHVEKVIANRKANHKGTTALSNALVNLKITLAEAKAEHSKAVNLFAAHSGFDAGLEVTNTTEAQKFLHEANVDMRSAKLFLRQAYQQTAGLVK